MLIREAWAQGAGTPGGGLESMLLIGLMFVVLYFLMIRPQMKRAKEHKAMVEALQRGDEVVTAGGVLGRISKLNENYITLATECGAGNCTTTGITVCMAGTVIDTCAPPEPESFIDDCGDGDEDCDAEMDEDFESGASYCGVAFFRACGCCRSIVRVAKRNASTRPNTAAATTMEGSAA